MSDKELPTLLPLRPRRVVKRVVPPPDSDSRSYVDVAEGWKPISVGMQNDEMVVWFDAAIPDGDTNRHIFIVANTGVARIPWRGDERFLGTVIATTGIVWHVWDGGANEMP